MPAWIAADGDGARLELLVQPRASRSRVVGPHGDRLKVQVAAPPVDGAANAAVVALMAAEAGVPKRAVTLVRGQTGRRKTVHVAGVDPAYLARRLSGTPAGAF